MFSRPCLTYTTDYPPAFHYNQKSSSKNAPKFRPGAYISIFLIFLHGGKNNAEATYGIRRKESRQQAGHQTAPSSPPVPARPGHQTPARRLQHGQKRHHPHRDQQPLRLRPGSKSTGRSVPRLIRLSD